MFFPSTSRDHLLWIQVPPETLNAVPNSISTSSSASLCSKLSRSAPASLDISSHQRHSRSPQQVIHCDHQPDHRRHVARTVVKQDATETVRAWKCAFEGTDTATHSCVDMRVEAARICHTRGWECVFEGPKTVSTRNALADGMGVRATLAKHVERSDDPPHTMICTHVHAT